ncbi:tyrosine-type recombinase/integrase [Pseudomonas mosselii]|uniref:tyrosine-type recombinase/integrase n=1 Tax=Pseudomonas mosselii TaxID=78327 RepID=UPI0024496310|nr:site-specific integrase [Pseudomonas mosselii]MDH1529169.1 site-specific integrase [Pseudomonas mosselii]
MTSVIAFSDAELRRRGDDLSAVLLRDPRYPGLRFRFTEARPRGTWYLVVRKRWYRIGAYPDQSAKVVLAALTEIRQRLAADNVATVSGWEQVGELLAWFADRLERNRSLSVKRKATAKSAISRHLIPRLGGMALADVSRSTLDRDLVWPLQEQLSLEYVRLVFGLLADAFKKAQALGMVATNPMAGMRFGDFTKARIKPKAARLRAEQIEHLLTLLAEVNAQAPTDAMLALLMLCHGNRVGETRMAQWPHISLATRRWYLPAEHTKTRVEHSLPLTDQVCALLTQYREFQQGQGYTGRFLFPGRSGRCLSEKQAAEVFTRLGQGEWTSHDLRKLARGSWADLGIDFLIGELLINHAMGHNVQVYIQTTAEERKRDALEQWHAFLDSKGFERIHGKKEARNADSGNGPQAAQREGCNGIQETTIGEDSKA